MEYLFDYFDLSYVSTRYKIFYIEQGVYWSVVFKFNQSQYCDSPPPDFYFTKQQKWVSEPKVKSELLTDIIKELIHFKVMNNWKELY